MMFKTSSRDILLFSAEKKSPGISMGSGESSRDLRFKLLFFKTNRNVGKSTFMLLETCGNSKKSILFG